MVQSSPVYRALLVGAVCLSAGGASAASATAAGVASMPASAAAADRAGVAPSGGVAVHAAGAARHAKVSGKPSPARKRKRAPRLPRGARLLSYAGQVGEVLHVRSSRSGVDPVSARTSWSSVEESWTELGGGQRQRSVWTQLPRRGSTDVETTVEAWSNPQLSVIRLMPAPGSRQPVPAPAGDLRCASTAGLAALGARSDIERVRGAQARLASGEQLPAGPVIDGRATVVVDPGPLGSVVGGGTAEGTLRFVLDRATGQLLRQTYSGRGVEVVTDFDVWEVLPAGGSDAELGRPVPANTAFNPAPDCELTERWVRGEF